MKKKIEVLILLMLLLGITLFFNFALASAQGELEKVEKNIEGFVEKGEQVTKKVEDTSEFLEEKKWQYLGGEWRKTLLNNALIAALDNALNRLDFVFFIVTGEEYSLSMAFLFTLVIWASFFVIIAYIFKLYTPFSEYVTWIVAFCFSVIISHLPLPSTELTIYQAISTPLFKIIFYKTGIWSWVLPLLGLLVYIFIFVYLRNFLKFRIKKKLETEGKENLEHKVEKHEAFIKGVREGYKE